MTSYTQFRQLLKDDWWEAAAFVQRWKLQAVTQKEFQHLCEGAGVSLRTAYYLLALRKRYTERPVGKWRNLL